MFWTVKLSALFVHSLLAFTAIIPPERRPQVASTASAVNAPTAPACNDAQGTPVPCSIDYYGGRVVENAKVYLVLWGPNVNNTVSAQLPAFYRAATNSDWMDWLTEYDTNVAASAGGHKGLAGTNQLIGRGVFAGTYTITPSVNAAVLTDAQIHDELDSQINSGALPYPDSNTLYMIHFPPRQSICNDALQADGTCAANSASCRAFCAYHGSYIRAGNNSVRYSVMPDFGDGSGCDVGCGPSATGNVTQQYLNTCSAASHELAEAVTDADVGGVKYLNYPLAWQGSSGGEIGDSCNQHQGVIAGLDGRNYLVQQLFSYRDYLSNAAGGCVTFSPRTEDFRVYFSPNAGTIAAGSSVNFPFALEATAGSPTSVQVQAGVGGAATASGAPSNIHVALASVPRTVTVTADEAAPAQRDVIVGVGAFDSAASVAHSATLLLQITPGPTISIGTPTSGSVLSGTAVVQVTAVAGGTAHLSKIAFQIDGAAAGTSDAGGRYSLDTTTLANSAHTLIAKAVDDDGGTRSASVTFSVLNAPSIAITSPSASQQVSGSTQITFAALPARGTTLASIALLVDGAMTGATAAATATQLIWDTTGVAEGMHTIAIRATDADGGTAISPAITVAVQNGDFALQAGASSVLVTIGGSAAIAVTTTAKGPRHTMALSVTGLPSGVTATFSPPSLTAGASATLTLSADRSAVASTGTLAITGVAGATQHSASLAIAVVAPAASGKGGGCATSQPSSALSIALGVALMMGIRRRRIVR
jgi:hypothetical protein